MAKTRVVTTVRKSSRNPSGKESLVAETSKKLTYRQLDRKAHRLLGYSGIRLSPSGLLCDLHCLGYMKQYIEIFGSMFQGSWVHGTDREQLEAIIVTLLLSEPEQNA
jgi:hypothetical protein